MQFQISRSALEYANLSPEKQKEYSDTMNEYWSSGRVEWHELNRHGVIRGISGSAAKQTIQKIINHFMGEGGSWWTGDNVEFIYMGNAYSKRGVKPWDWCGTSVLHETVHQHYIEYDSIKENFRVGDVVSFDYDGETFTGVISGIRKRATVVVPNRGKFYIPVTHLRAK